MREYIRTDMALPNEGQMVFFQMVDTFRAGRFANGMFVANDGSGKVDPRDVRLWYDFGGDAPGLAPKP